MNGQTDVPIGPISLRHLFSRGIFGEVTSFRHSLENHPFGLTIGLREIHSRLLQPMNGDGFARGCRREDDIKIELELGVGEKTIRPIGQVLPQWVPVTGNTRLVRDHRDGQTRARLITDHVGETRTVEGVLTVSKVSDTDFPLLPWHKYYDWNFIIRVDRQYAYLLSQAIIEEPHPNWRGGHFECEWDTGFLPSFAWPQEGDRIWLVGRWIYDCGHPHGKTGKHRTELHPVKAVASFRSEAKPLPGNGGPTQANNAVLYIGQKGGYWDQPINDQDYAFDLYLPPKPYAESVPVWAWEEMTILPVAPRITPYPADNPKALRVVIPLKGVNPPPEDYGAIISAGWSDPRRTETSKIRHVRVTLEKLLMYRKEVDSPGPLHPPPFPKPPHDKKPPRPSTFDWNVYVGVNGRWIIERFSTASDNPQPKSSEFSVELFLHPSDQIHVTACGFEADAVNRLIGRDTGLTWADVSDSSQSKDIGEKIIDYFLSLDTHLISGGGIENDPIDLFSKKHGPSSQDKFTEASVDGQYRLQYRIDQL